MKRQNTILLFCFFSLLPIPFVIGIFTDGAGLGALWDAISFVIVYVAAILLFLTTLLFLLFFLEKISEGIVVINRKLAHKH